MSVASYILGPNQKGIASSQSRPVDLRHVKTYQRQDMERDLWWLLRMAHQPARESKLDGFVTVPRVFEPPSLRGFVALHLR